MYMSFAYTVGHYRFSCLSETLLRIEYAPEGRFEDRRSFRALTRPEPKVFDRIEQDGPATVLHTKALCLQLQNETAAPTGNNLQVEFSGGRWWPGAVDHQNLGGCHCSMDCIHEAFIPEGVHPATQALHDNGCHWSLWNYTWRRKGKASGEIEAENRYQNLSLGQIVRESDRSAWPEPLRELIEEREKYPPGILSRSGYFLFNDSTTPLIDPEQQWITPRPPQDGYQDWYLFAYGNDFKTALRDYRALCGATPLLPRYALGLWYSRYPTVAQQGLIETVEAFEASGMPLSVLVLDLEWHRGGWSGWDWDHSHIPDPQALLRYLHKKGIHTTLNLHPEMLPISDSRADAFLEAAGIDRSTAPISLDERGGKCYKQAYFSDNQQQMQAFMEVLHDPVKRDGIDFWWMDGLVELEKTAHLDPQMWTNHVYQTHASRTYPEERPMVMARTAGIGAHRYAFHFTGDTYCQWPVLKSSVEYLLRAGHIGQSYLTHDIGGHIGYGGENLPEELYLRWVQFGALSPICRLHSAGGSERRPWKYSPETLTGVHEALALRTRLIPYLYNLARESAEAGLPICRSNCLEATDWEAGYAIWDRYFIGDRLFAAPILTPGEHHEAVLPPGEWYCGLSGQFLTSDGTQVHRLITSPTKAPPHFFKAGTVCVLATQNTPAGEIPEVLEVHCFLAQGGGSRSDYTLYEDDGYTTHHQTGAYCLTQFDMVQHADQLKLEITQPHQGIADPSPRRYRIYIHTPEITTSGPAGIFQQEVSLSTKGVSLELALH